jgi:hypothetical protein
LLLVICAWSVTAQDTALPSLANSVKFAAIGDMGTGDSPQYDVANVMVRMHAKFPFDRVIMLGDNIYGGQGPADLTKKFSQPFKPLLDMGVTFYASIGNHDDPRNVGCAMAHGRRTLLHLRDEERAVLRARQQQGRSEAARLARGALKSAREDWKICYFHHPMYSDGGAHGSSIDVRVRFEPLFLSYGVNVVFAGHDHIYERLKPQKGIYYFVSGAGGELRKGDTKPSAMTAKAFDQDQSFMLVEIAGDVLSFQAISRQHDRRFRTIQRQVRR